MADGERTEPAKVAAGCGLVVVLVLGLAVLLAVAWRVFVWIA